MNGLKKYPLAAGEAELTMELTCSEMIDDLEKNRYTTYGLQVVDHEGNVLFAKADVDTQKEFVEQFVQLCAQHDIRLIHLPDLLEDYLDERWSL